MRFFLLFFIFFNFLTFGSETNDPYLGYWLLPNEKVIVEIQKNNDEYVGYVRWLKEARYPVGDKMEGVEQIDRNNPDPLLRNRKVLNLQVIGGMKKNQKNQLIGGWIYDSWNGKTYYGTASFLNDQTLKLKGSIDKFGLLSYSFKTNKVNLKNYM